MTSPSQKSFLSNIFLEKCQIGGSNSNHFMRERMFCNGSFTKHFKISLNRYTFFFWPIFSLSLSFIIFATSTNHHHSFLSLFTLIKTRLHSHIRLIVAPLYHLLGFSSLSLSLSLTQIKVSSPQLKALINTVLSIAGA